MYQALSKEFILAGGCMDIESFDAAAARYPFKVLSGTAEAMEQFLAMAVKDNEGHAYADFYYPVLKAEEQKRFMKALDERQREMAENFAVDRQNVYYRLDEKNLPFLSSITARELLFSSFYFVRYKAVVWGNYNMKYPLFCESEEVLEYYIVMAGQNGLKAEV